MNTISAIVLTKNEEERIADCLDTLSFCTEIIIVDSASEDRTVDIAKRMGASVVDSKTSDFSQKRTEGLRKAKGDWILYVDADEQVTPSLRDNIKSKISDIEYQNYSAYKIKRKNFYFGNHEWPHVEELERLFRKNSLKGWYGKLHESPKYEGEIGQLDGFILHYSHRDLTSMLNKTIEWSEVEAKLRFEAGHPKMTWWRFPRVMITAFLNSYILQKGWKTGTVGLIESTYQAFSAFITYARLWEMQHKK